MVGFGVAFATAEPGPRLPNRRIERPDGDSSERCFHCSATGHSFRRCRFTRDAELISM